MPKVIVIFGGSGVIAQSLIPDFLAEDNIVYCFEYKRKIPFDNDNLIVFSDLSEIESIDIDLIIHMAGYSSLEGKTDFQLIENRTKKILEFGEQRKIGKIIFLSTIGIEFLEDINSKRRPKYIESKWRCEKLIQSSSIEIKVILRLGTVWSEDTLLKNQKPYITKYLGSKYMLFLPRFNMYITDIDDVRCSFQRAIKTNESSTEVVYSCKVTLKKLIHHLSPSTPFIFEIPSSLLRVLRIVSFWGNSLFYEKCIYILTFKDKEIMSTVKSRKLVEVLGDI